jgi:hypothetical protein
MPQQAVADADRVREALHDTADQADMSASRISGLYSCLPNVPLNLSCCLLLP